MLDRTAWRVTRRRPKGQAPACDGARSDAVKHHVLPSRSARKYHSTTHIRRTVVPGALLPTRPNTHLQVLAAARPAAAPAARPPAAVPVHHKLGKVIAFISVIVVLGKRPGCPAGPSPASVGQGLPARRRRAGCCTAQRTSSGISENDLGMHSGRMHFTGKRATKSDIGSIPHLRLRL